MILLCGQKNMPAFWGQPEDSAMTMTIPPWYKQFWPWVLIGLPASVVIASMVTLLLALRSPVSLVVDDYYKEGLAINQDMARQRRAEAKGLRGDFSLVMGTGTVQLTLNQDLGTARQLKLSLIHSTRASEDRAGLLTLDMQGNLSGLVKPLIPGRWLVIVEPPDGEWRLSGEVRIAGPSDTVQVALVPG